MDLSGREEISHDEKSRGRNRGFERDGHFFVISLFDQSELTRGPESALQHQRLETTGRC